MIDPLEQQFKEELKAKLSSVEEGGFPHVMLEELYIGVRAYNGLRMSGITTLKQLVQMTRKELLACDGMGEKSVNELESMLESVGLSLAKQPTYERAVQIARREVFLALAKEFTRLANEGE